ncbi:MAG: hypothetical protein O3C48_05390 [Crenarchaeota archaeon]|nr:hypothetical protein [Thermoproteota archaeon]
MSEDKTLPKDYDETSLPGRFEESNYTDTSIHTSTKPKNRGLILGMVLFAVFAVGIFSYYFINQADIDQQIIQNTLKMTPEQILANQYNIGEFGSDHAHAAIVVIINNKQVNFAEQQFQLSSKYIHFENDNPYQIHKHATGVPLEMLFASFGSNGNCILNEPCDSQTVYLNGEKYYSDILQYEIKHNDRILISFGEQSVVEYLRYLESLKIFEVPKKSANIGNEIFI